MPDFSRFDFAAKEWRGPTTDRLPKHTLHFGSPCPDPADGIPLGDGETGSLIWLSEDAIHIQVNKTDLWSESSRDGDYITPDYEEDLPCLRNGGEIVIGFHTPAFDPFYPQKYSADLSLADAKLTVVSETAFSNLNMEAFASHKAGAGILRGTYRSTEPDAPTVTLHRFGSRNFWRWYGQRKSMPEAGLEGTESYAAADALFITQHLVGTDFCIGLYLQTNEAHDSVRRNSHEAALALANACGHSFTLYWKIVTGADAEDARAKCEAGLRDAVTAGFDALYDAHRADWADFWNRSGVRIADDYIENLYYLSLYYSNCECRGAFPPHFTCGVWGFRHDFIPWTYYFHYNMQHMYAPLEPAGHGDLVLPMHRMRREQLDVVKRYAKEVKGKNGAFYHDVTDRKGRAPKYDSLNCTPGAQIALSMWRHWRFSGDDAFLRETALPVMRETAAFYLDILERGDDGLLHLHDTTAYEGNVPTDDTLTDQVMIRALLGALISLPDDLVGKDEKAVYEKTIADLPEFLYQPLDGDDWDGEKFLWGIGKGEAPAKGHEVFAMGRDKEGKPLRRDYANPARAVYGFPDIGLSLLYPSSLYGLADKGTRAYYALENHLSIHPHPNGCMHWCMMPLYLARMGQADRLAAYMREDITLFQIFKNGMNADGPSGIPYVTDTRFHSNVRDVENDKKIPVAMRDFRYFDFETLPIVAAAVNESLLQSHGGVLRPFPATRREDDASFTLFGEGGFRVSGEKIGTHVVLTVDCLRDEAPVLSLPDWVDTGALRVFAAAPGEAFRPIEPVREARGGDTVYLFPGTGRGDLILVTDLAPDALAGKAPAPEAPNRLCKILTKEDVHDPVMLGSPEAF